MVSSQCIFHLEVANHDVIQDMKSVSVSNKLTCMSPCDSAHPSHRQLVAPLQYVLNCYLRLTDAHIKLVTAFSNEDAFAELYYSELLTLYVIRTL